MSRLYASDGTVHDSSGYDVVRTSNAGRSNGERMTRTPIWHYRRPAQHFTLCGADTAGWTDKRPDRAAMICQKCARDLRRRQ